MRATHRRGAAATELALFLPFLALLFFVAVDYARAFRAAQVIDGCARTGALYASGAAGRSSVPTILGKCFASGHTFPLIWDTRRGTPREYIAPRKLDRGWDCEPGPKR